jgi:hypothetical protein
MSNFFPGEIPSPYMTYFDRERAPLYTDRAVHQRTREGVLCKTQNRWPSCQLSSVNNADRVTCKNCSRILKRLFEAISR